MAAASNEARESQPYPRSQREGRFRGGTAAIVTRYTHVNDPPLSSSTVLVVEDEFFIRMSAVDIVRDAGLSVLEAASASEALEILRNHPEVAVLFTDIDMPGGMDGIELAEKVHAQKPAVQLMLTSGRVRPIAADIPDDGVFLAKPYSEADLMRLLRELISRNDAAFRQEPAAI